MIKLFKIKKRKVWHIVGNYKEYETRSYCFNAEFALSIEATEPELDYVDYMEVDEIPQEIHDGLCKACIQHAFSDGIVKIIANKGE